MKLKAIVVDDEQHSRETLKAMLDEFCPDIEVLQALSSIEEALVVIPKLDPDVVFLDIELQTGTGFDLLERLKTINFEVIFTTAFEQFAIRAVKFSSLDYLLKPIDLEELLMAVEKAKKIKDKDVYNRQLETLIQNLKQQQSDLKKICLSTSEGYEFINVEDIIYCKAEGSYTHFQLKNKTRHLVSKHLKEYENLLSEYAFLRVHNTYLINLKEVKKYIKSDGGYILMNNDEAVAVSRTKKELFFEMMRTMST